MSVFAVDLAMGGEIYISDGTICTYSYVGYLGYITDQLQIITHMRKTPKYKNRRDPIIFFDSNLGDYGVEFYGNNDRK